MKPKDFVEQLKGILDQHIELVKSNSQLLQINLDLMKENDELKKDLIKYQNHSPTEPEGSLDASSKEVGGSVPIPSGDEL